MNWRILISTELVLVKIDGLRNAIRSKRTGSGCMWLAIMLASTCCCVWFIGNCVHEYLKYDVTSTTRSIVDSSAVFPTITICNYYSFYSTYADQVFSTLGVSNVYELEAKFKNQTGHYLSRELKKNMSDIDGLIISCTFQGKTCNASDFQFVETFMLNLNCYRFNSGYDANGRQVPLKRVNSIGDVKYNSLSMELFAGQAFSTKKPFRGFDVYVDFSGGASYNSIIKTISLSPGVGLSIAVKRYVSTQFNQWPYEYSECTVNADNSLIRPLEDTSFVEATIRLNSSYTRDACLYLCSQLVIAEACNCTNYYMDGLKLDNYEYCLTVAQTTCVNKVYVAITFGGLASRKCYEKCPLECHKKFYNIFLSGYNYPTQQYADQVLSKNEKLVDAYSNLYDFTHNLVNNAVQFMVYYDSLSYTSSVESPKITLENLIGMIGGHLNVFLGISLLSFIELFDFLLVLAFEAKNRMSF